jgi:hypothetical protein
MSVGVMAIRYVVSLAFSISMISAAVAAEHRVVTLEESPPADAISEDILSQISTKGFTVIRGESRTVCQIWLCRDWPVVADFKARSEVLYPFKPGQLIGVLRYKRKGSDFRDQDIARGVYTLRYGQQPVDGNHEGTSPTRDFLLLVRADADKSSEPMDPKQALELSAEAAESSHPALLSLQKVDGDGESIPTMRYNADQDWWIVQLKGRATAGDTAHDLRLDFVVAGHAAE